MNFLDFILLTKTSAILAFRLVLKGIVAFNFQSEAFL
jgi:hypothetical protein